MVDVRNCFLAPSSFDDKMHLFVIAIKSGPRFLLINITSIHENVYHDPTCVLNADDHPFLDHPSYVIYQHSKLMGEVEISKQVASGRWVVRDDISEEVLQKIINGFSKSIHTPRWVCDEL